MPKKNPIIAPKQKKLDDRQEKFCREYLSDFNATRAARAAGYSDKSARVQASGLLTRLDIQDRIQELAKQIYEEVGDPIQRIILDLQMQAFGDLADFMEWSEDRIKWKDSKDLGHKTKMVQEVTETINSSGGSRKFKLYDRQKAQELLLRYYGVFKDANPVDGGTVTTRVVLNIVSNGREKAKVIEAEFKETT